MNKISTQIHCIQIEMNKNSKCFEEIIKNQLMQVYGLKKKWFNIDKNFDQLDLKSWNELSLKNLI